VINHNAEPKSLLADEPVAATEAWAY